MSGCGCVGVVVTIFEECVDVEVVIIMLDHVTGVHSTM